MDAYNTLCKLGRYAGREITFDQMLNCDFDMAPTVADLTMDSGSPLAPDANGRYPVPQPGIPDESRILSA